jgi:predicted Zn-ribbon and HTH transcriptional regulator
MSRKSPNLALSMPRCRNCGRHWRPPEGVSSSRTYCRRCAKERRAIAASKFGLITLMPSDFSGPYVLPRRLRP